jgi:hypothetical protein
MVMMMMMRFSHAISLKPSMLILYGEVNYMKQRIVLSNFSHQFIYLAAI